MTEIYRSEYFRVELERGGQIVRLTRSSTPYPSAQAFIDEAHAVAVKLDLIGRSGRALLADVRGAPGRNDEPFDQAIEKAVPALQRGFKRVVLLVRTAAGALHGKRHPVMHKENASVATDEASAIEWLLTGRG